MYRLLLTVSDWSNLSLIIGAITGILGTFIALGGLILSYLAHRREERREKREAELLSNQE